MDIALIAPTWLPIPAPGYGGTEAVVDLLARGLHDAGHGVLLIGHPDSTCPVPRASVVSAADTVPMARASIELEHAIGAYDLARHADVIHDHTLAGPVYAPRVPGPAVIVTNHNVFSRTMNAILGAAVPRVGIVAISRSHAASTTLPIDAVIHHGIDLATFPVGTGDGGYVAFLGRMSATKGVHVAIEAARSAGLPLRIAAKMADGRERAYYEQHVEPLLGGDVEYLGEIDASAKRELLAGAIALVNPIQWREPFGMVMLEALACGTPVVGFGEGAAPEIVDDGESGFLVQTADQLADALRAAKTLDRAACRARAATFSVDAMVARYVEVFERRIALGRARRA